VPPFQTRDSHVNEYRVTRSSGWSNLKSLNVHEKRGSKVHFAGNARDPVRLEGGAMHEMADLAVLVHT
jgi:hypothetical protein